jgi:hypothetical protein
VRISKSKFGRTCCPIKPSTQWFFITTNGDLNHYLRARSRLVFTWGSIPPSGYHPPIRSIRSPTFHWRAGKARRVGKTRRKDAEPSFRWRLGWLGVVAANQLDSPGSTKSGALCVGFRLQLRSDAKMIVMDKSSNSSERNHTQGMKRPNQRIGS